MKRRDPVVRGPLNFAVPGPMDTIAATDGQPFEHLLGEGEDPGRAVAALAGKIQAALKSWTGGTASILFDNGSKTITVESRAPAPEGTSVFRASITLCVDSLIEEDGCRRLSIVPRVMAETLIWKNGVAWIAHGSEDQFAGYVQQIQDRIGEVSP